MKSRVRYIDSLSEKEKHNMDKEIMKQILEKDEIFSKECDALILWTLHVYFGFGEKRLRKFWEFYFSEHKRLREKYELKPEDTNWLYKKKLKSIGVDLDEWHNEINE